MYFQPCHQPQIPVFQSLHHRLVAHCPSKALLRSDPPDPIEPRHRPPGRPGKPRHTWPAACARSSLPPRPPWAPWDIWGHCTNLKFQLSKLETLWNLMELYIKECKLNMLLLSMFVGPLRVKVWTPEFQHTKESLERAEKNCDWDRLNPGSYWAMARLTPAKANCWDPAKVIAGAVAPWTFSRSTICKRL